MDRFNDVRNKVTSQVSEVFIKMNSNTYAKLLVYVLMLLYINQLVHMIPVGVLVYLNNVIVKLVLLVASAFLIVQDVPVGLLFSLMVYSTLCVAWKKTVLMPNIALAVSSRVVQKPVMEQPQQVMREKMESLPMLEHLDMPVEMNSELLGELNADRPVNVVQEDHKDVLVQQPVLDMQPPMGGQEESKQGCGVMKGNYHNSFYPQYTNMKPDAYMARYTGDSVNGYDPTATYSRIN